MIKTRKKQTKNSWKRKKIVSTKEAISFLEGQLTSRFFKNVGYLKNLQFNFDKTNGLHGDIKGNFNGARQEIMSIELGVADNHMKWEHLSVNVSLRANCIGSMATKCVLGITHEHNKKYIELINIQNDGRFVWPAMGATPKNNIPFTDSLEGYKELYTSHYSPEEHKYMNQIIAIDRTTPNDPNHTAWRMLAQSNIKHPHGHPLKNHIFRSCCFGRNLILDLTHPETVKTLKKRIGVIPYFSSTPTHPPIKTKVTSCIEVHV